MNPYANPESHARPADCVSLLSQAVDAARRAPFWKEKLGNAALPNPINSLADFERLPITPASEYRRQRFHAVLSNVAGIEWIPGPLLGQSPERVPVAEGASEAAIRVGLLRDGLALAIPKAIPNRANPDGLGAVIVATESSRHFGAETCAAFVRMGVSAHLLIDTATDRLKTLLDAFKPDVVVALSPRVDLDALPGSVAAVATVSAGETAEPPSDIPIRRVSLLVQNELGVLGMSIDGKPYRMNHHRFHLERSPAGTLVATPYHARVQPIIRLDTGMPASVLS